MSAFRIFVQQSGHSQIGTNEATEFACLMHNVGSAQLTSAAIRLPS